jgi:hypothetical protein
MPTMGYQQYTGGMLGWAAGEDLLADGNLLKTEGRVSLLAFATPSGANYIVVLDYGEVSYDVVFPTTSKPAKSGNSKVCKSSTEAFAEFNAIVSTYGTLPSNSDGTDPSRASTFEELDQKLLSMAELPKDIVVELQRSGVSDTGRPKVTFNLQFKDSLLSAFVGSNKDGLRMARLHYESFPLQVRLKGLQDLRSSVLAKYMVGELVAALLQTNRSKRDIYREGISKGMFTDISMPEALNQMSTVSPNPFIAIRIRFVDQNGKEISGLPYEINARGILNFSEAYQKTQGGANPGSFSSGTSLMELGMSDMLHGDSVSGALIENWTGRSLNPSGFYHLLYKYRTTGSEGMPRGTVKISITTSRNINDPADWGNKRLQVYDTPGDASETRAGNPIPANPKMLLYSHNYRLQADDTPERMTITVPVFVEPLPSHLIESPPGSGRVVSRWSIASDEGEIPAHQKVQVEFTVLRPEATGLWEKADQMLPDSRDGYNDGMLQYDEFTSPEGRAAYRDNTTKASPVKGIRFVLLPDESNAWIVSKKPRVMKPNFSGKMSAGLTPGKYYLGMMVEINADGTSGLEIVTSAADKRWELATLFSQLSTDLQSAVRQKYGDESIDRSTRFAPKILDLGIVECPGAFYYRKTSSKDTTPIGVTGVKMVRTGSIADTGSSRFRRYHLKQSIPPLPAGKEPESGSIYDVMGIEFPTIDSGWPSGSSTETDERIFDEVSLYLSPDSSIDLSLLSQYEQRYEAERDAGDGISPRLKAPGVGQRIEYMGYYIENLYFDTAVGPSLTNRSEVFGGGTHEYDMGRLETPFWDIGVIRCMVFYPISGVMRRKMVVPSTTNVNSSLVMKARSQFTQWNPSQASMDRVYHFNVKASPEGAILSGRWVPLESVGSHQASETDDAGFKKIIEAIKKGGLPVRSSKKWNQFWSTTMDGWLFGGDKVTTNPGLIEAGETAISGGNLIVGQGQSALSAYDSGAGTPLMGGISKMETEDGVLGDTMNAPAPDYGDADDEMGFVEG